MREAEDLWMQIWMGTPPWANDQDRTINFAKAVTGEAARLATMGVSVELSGSARADWLQERLNEELIPFLRDMVDVGCAAGMFLLKPTPDSIGLYTPPEFTITAVDNRKRVTGVVLYDTKATPDYYYVKAEYHRYDGMHYVVSNRAFRLAKGKASASRVNLDEVPDWVGILPDAVLDDTAPLFAVCTMPDANNIDGGACGMSIYANALPELRGLWRRGGWGRPRPRVSPCRGRIHIYWPAARGRHRPRCCGRPECTRSSAAARLRGCL